jgi:YfiH family protein
VSLPAGWIVPDWPVPGGVRAFVTTRAGGVSTGEYASMNLGGNSGDDPKSVAANRLIVREHLPSMPRWLAQVHGTGVADLDSLGEGVVARADAAMTGVAGRVAVVLTADCMPLFLAARDGKRIAVVHGGWRGLAAGVVESTLAAMRLPHGEVVAWMGPAIGPGRFEVGAEVRQAFVRVDPEAARAFVPGAPGKYMADLYALARRRLERAGVTNVYGGGFCTLTDSQRFFSYRRARESGRMGAFIWIE